MNSFSLKEIKIGTCVTCLKDNSKHRIVLIKEEQGKRFKRIDIHLENLFTGDHQIISKGQFRSDYKIDSICEVLYGTTKV